MKLRRFAAFALSLVLALSSVPVGTVRSYADPAEGTTYENVDPGQNNDVTDDQSGSDNEGEGQNDSNTGGNGSVDNANGQGGSSQDGDLSEGDDQNDDDDQDSDNKQTDGEETDGEDENGETAGDEQNSDLNSDDEQDPDNGKDDVSDDKDVTPDKEGSGETLTPVTNTVNVHDVRDGSTDKPFLGNTEGYEDINWEFANQIKSLSLVPSNGGYTADFTYTSEYSQYTNFNIYFYESADSTSSYDFEVVRIDNFTSGENIYKTVGYIENLIPGRKYYYRIQFSSQDYDLQWCTGMCVLEIPNGDDITIDVSKATVSTGYAAGTISGVVLSNDYAASQTFSVVDVNNDEILGVGSLQLDPETNKRYISFGIHSDNTVTCRIKLSLGSGDDAKTYQSDTFTVTPKNFTANSFTSSVVPRSCSALATVTFDPCYNDSLMGAMDAIRVELNIRKKGTTDDYIAFVDGQYAFNSISSIEILADNLDENTEYEYYFKFKNDNTGALLYDGNQLVNPSFSTSGELIVYTEDQIKGMFPDDSFRELVSNAITGYPSGEVFTSDDLLKVTSLDSYYNGQGTPIESLEGIQNFPNLARLQLNGHDITEIPDAISDLNKLRDLSVEYCLVEHMPDLTGCTALVNVDLDYNRIPDDEMTADKYPEGYSGIVYHPQLGEPAAITAPRYYEHNGKIPFIMEVSSARSGRNYVLTLEADGVEKSATVNFSSGWMTSLHFEVEDALKATSTSATYSVKDEWTGKEVVSGTATFTCDEDGVTGGAERYYSPGEWSISYPVYIYDENEYSPSDITDMIITGSDGTRYEGYLSNGVQTNTMLDNRYDEAGFTDYKNTTMKCSYFNVNASREQGNPFPGGDYSVSLKIKGKQVNFENKIHISDAAVITALSHDSYDYPESIGQGYVYLYVGQANLSKTDFTLELYRGNKKVAELDDLFSGTSTLIAKLKILDPEAFALANGQNFEQRVFDYRLSDNVIDKTNNKGKITIRIDNAEYAIVRNVLFNYKTQKLEAYFIPSMEGSRIKVSVYASQDISVDPIATSEETVVTNRKVDLTFTDSDGNSYIPPDYSNLCYYYDIIETSTPSHMKTYHQNSRVRWYNYSQISLATRGSYLQSQQNNLTEGYCMLWSKCDEAYPVMVKIFDPCDDSLVKTLTFDYENSKPTSVMKNGKWVPAVERLTYITEEDIEGLDPNKVYRISITDGLGSTADYGYFSAYTVPASSIALDSHSETLYLGRDKYFNLKATVKPDNASSKITWTSSDESIATVTSTGVVVLNDNRKPGQVVITAATADGSNKSDSCTITVKTVPVTGVVIKDTGNLITNSVSGNTLSGKTIDVEYGRTATLTLYGETTPEDATNRDLEWTSSETSVATVTSDGSLNSSATVTINGVGKTKIRATAKDGSGKYAEITINVKSVPVSSVSIYKSVDGHPENDVSVAETDIFAGSVSNEVRLKAVIDPADATTKKVNWTTSNNKVVTVTIDPDNEEYVIVRSVGIGTAKVTATTTDGTKKSAVCTINVLNNVCNITYNLNGGKNPVNGEGVGINPVTYEIMTNTPLSDPVRSGYNFGGWYTDKDFADGTKVTAITEDFRGDITLYARWTAKDNIVVTLDSGKGKYDVDPEWEDHTSDNKTETVVYNRAYGELPVPTLAGRTFVGWFSDWDDQNGACGNEIRPETIVETDENHTLYAKYDNNEMTVSFNANGHASAIVPDPFTVPYGSTIPGAEDGRPDPGYRFDGWYKDAACSADRVWDFEHDVVKADTVLYAKWVKFYTLNLNLNGGNFYDSEYRETAEYEASREGASETVKQTAKLYNSDHIIVTVDADVADDKNINQILRDIYGQDFDPIADYKKPVKTGYVFDGWSTSPGGEDPFSLTGGDYVDNSTHITYVEEGHLKNDTVLYARWIPKETVEYPVWSLTSESQGKRSGENSFEYFYEDAVIKLSSGTPDAKIYYRTDDAGTYRLYTDGIKLSSISERHDDSGDTYKVRIYTYSHKDGMGDGYIPNDPHPYYEFEVLKSSADWGDVIVADQGKFADASEVPSGFWVTDNPSPLAYDYNYSGAAKTFTFGADGDFRVYYGKKLLELNTDFTVKYANNVNANFYEGPGTWRNPKAIPSVTITLKGNYSGSVTRAFEINPVSIAGATIADPTVRLFYNGKVQKPGNTITMNLGGKVVTLNGKTDYTLTYPKTDSKIKEGVDAYDANAFKASVEEEHPYVVRVTGKGNYCGEITYNVVIRDKIGSDKTVKLDDLDISISDVTIRETYPLDHPENKYWTGELTNNDGLTITYGNNKLKVFGRPVEKEEVPSGADQLDALFAPGGAWEGWYFVWYCEGADDVGPATATFIGNKYLGYEGTKTVTYNVVPIAINSKNIKFNGLAKSYPWQAGGVRALEKGVTVQYASKYWSASLVEGADKDFTCAYTGDLNSGTVTMKITGTGVHYAGEATATYTIAGTALTAKNVTFTLGDAVFAPGNYTYTGAGIYPSREGKVSGGAEKVVLTYNKGTANEAVLANGTDYDVTYSADPVNAGTYKITYQFKGKYTGKIERSFKVVAYNILSDERDLITVGAIPAQQYYKGGTRPVPVVSYNGTPLIAGTDYTVTYKNNVNAYGIAYGEDGFKANSAPTVIIKGIGNYAGTVNAYYKIVGRTDIDAISMTAYDRAYTNKAGNFTTSVVLTDSDGKKLVAGTDYCNYNDKNSPFVYRYVEDTDLADGTSRKKDDIVGSSDIVPAGTILSVEVTLKGNYSGTLTKNFRLYGQDISKAAITVNPQFYTGSEVCPDKSQIVVTVNKHVLAAQDYEIVSYSNNVNKGTAKVTICGVGDYGGTKTGNFTIKATPSGYVLSFNNNGATSGGIKDLSLAANTSYTVSSDLKRANYVFEGFATSVNGSAIQAVEGVYTVNDYLSYEIDSKGRFVFTTNANTKTGVVMLYAKWAPVEYTITYYTNGGVNNPKNEAADHQGYNPDSEDITIYAPEREDWPLGYQFGGWYKDSAYKNRISVIKTGSSGDLTLYAKWIPYTYTVSFNINATDEEIASKAATGTMADEVFSYGVSKKLNNNAFKRKNYVFLGWSNRPDGEADLNNGQSVVNLLPPANNMNGQVTLYAIWSNRFDVYYELNDGHMPPDILDEVSGQYHHAYSESYRYGEGLAVSALPVPGRPGYVFGGWFFDAAFKKPAKGISKTTSGNVTLYAKWTAMTYTVTFNGNGNKNAPVNGKMNAIGGTYDTKPVTLTANAFTRKGYVFGGWNTALDGSGIAYGNVEVINHRPERNKETLTLYAMWDPVEEYEAVFDAGEGLIGNDHVNRRSRAVGSAIAAADMPQPVRAGYIFGGWFTDAACKTKVVKAIAATENKDTYLYAKWTAMTYSVSFRANGLDANGAADSVNPVKGTMKAQSATYGNSITLSNNAFTRKNYKFTGWNTASDGTGTAYANGASVNLVPTGNKEVKVLYAQWAPLAGYGNVYTVTFEGNGGTNEDGTAIAAKTYGVTENGKGGIPAGEMPRPVKDGYTFAGWFTNPALSGKALTAVAESYYSDITLYAKWTGKKYTTRFNVDVPEYATVRASGSMKAQSLTYGTQTALTKNAFKLPGYEFLGWSTESYATRTEGLTPAQKDLYDSDPLGYTGHEDDVAFMNAQRVTGISDEYHETENLYGVWKRTEYSIVYNNVAEDNSGNPYSYNVETGEIVLREPYSLGDTFLGWYSDAKFKKKVTTIPANSTGTKTFYAKWATTQYTIRYDLNCKDDSVRLDTTKVGYITSYDGNTENGYLLPVADREGYVFGGWYKEAKCKTKVSSIIQSPYVDMTLYAKWTAND